MSEATRSRGTQSGPRSSGSVQPGRSSWIAVLVLSLITAAGCAKEKRDSKGRPVRSGTLRLRTFPAGARVWVDGELKVESTPATLVLQAGEYRVRIQARGAEAVEHTIEIEAGERKELTLNIPKPLPARITVLSDIVGADVRINGYRRGETPLMGVVTRPGPVDITVTTPTGRAKSVRGDLAIGEQKTIEVFFEPVASSPDAPKPPVLQSKPPPVGYLTLGLKPEGEVYTSEGERLGSTPIVRRPIEPGEHELLLRSLDGRYEKRVVAEVEAGQTAVFRFMFRDQDQVPGWRAPVDGGTR